MRCIAYAACALLLTTRLQAQPARVLVALPHCDHPSWSDAELLDALELELGNDGVSEVARAAAIEAAQLSVEDACDPGRPTARLSVRAEHGKRAERDVDLADTPEELRARALALALSELWRGSWFTARVQSAGAPATPAETPDTPPPTAAADQGLAWTLGPALRFFAARGNWLYGASTAFYGLQLELGASVLLGSSDDVLGTLHYGVAELFALYELLHVRAGDFRFGLGPRLAIGLAWGNAAAVAGAEASSALDLIWNAAAQLRIARSLGSDWSLALVLLAGYARGPEYASKSTQVRLAGFMAGAGLSVVWRFAE